MIRCFFGVPVDNSEEIREIQDMFADSPFRMTEVQNLHMTILFLGDRGKSDVDAIISRMKEAKFNTPAVIVQSIIGLPRNSRATVLALSVSGNGLTDIYNKVTEISQHTDIRGFLPHITIGRSRRPISLNRSWIEKRFDIKLKVSRVSFIRSDLTPDGPVYTDLCSNYFI
jgi:2'-5' RNA ligase